MPLLLSQAILQSAFTFINNSLTLNASEYLLFQIQLECKHYSFLYLLSLYQLWCCVIDLSTNLRVFDVILKLSLQGEETEPSPKLLESRDLSHNFQFLCSGEQVNLAMKIQLSPVTISPSMYFPLPLPHIPTRTSTSVHIGLLEAAQLGKRLLLVLSILATPSPFWEREHSLPAVLFHKWFCAGLHQSLVLIHYILLSV